MRRRLPWWKALFACGLAIPHALACLPSNSPGPEPDTDHDGLSDREELQVYGTSPLMADTDGDGMNDFQEVVTNGFDPGNDPDRFNPRVADLPFISVVIAGPPIVRFNATLSDGTTVTIDNSVADSVTLGVTDTLTQHQGRSDTQSFAQTFTQDQSQSPSTMNQTSLTTPLGNEVATTVIVTDAGAGPDADARVAEDAEDGEDGPDNEDAEIPDSGAAPDVSEAPAGAVVTTTSMPPTLTQTQGDSNTLTFGNSVSSTVNPSTTVDTFVEFSRAQSQQNQRTLTQGQSLATSHQVAVVSANLRVATMLENNSHVAFRCTNLFLGAVLVEFNGALLALGNMELDESIVTTFVPFALAPGERTGPVNFVLPGIELSAAFDILGSGRGLIMNIATYELDDKSGTPYAFDLTDIGSKTALVAIDYGKSSTRQPELYQVATNFDPSHPGASASEIFQNILHVPYFASPQTGLVAVRNTAMTSSGGPHWSVALTHDSGPDIETTSYGGDADPYDFDGIQVGAGDVLHLAYVGKGSAVSDAGTARPPLGSVPAPSASYPTVVERPPDASVPPGAGPP
jgi:hypothetical protein